MEQGDVVGVRPPEAFVRRVAAAQRPGQRQPAQPAEVELEDVDTETFRGERALQVLAVRAVAEGLLDADGEALSWGTPVILRSDAPVDAG